MGKQLRRSKILILMALSLLAVGLFMHFAAKPTPDRPTYQTSVKLPESHMNYEGALGMGETAPAFTLPAQNGDVFSLKDALKKGPVVLTFFRGNWCPICAAHLKSLSLEKARINKLGGQLVALSAQTPAKTALTREKFRIDFPVLSDQGMRVAEAYGVAWQIPESDRAGFTAWLDKSTGESLIDYHGGEQDNQRVTDEYTLPVPATYVIAPNGNVVYAHVDENYRNRADPQTIIKALKALK